MVPKPQSYSYLKKKFLILLVIIYDGEEYSKQAAKVKESVRVMLNKKDMRVLDQLELVNNLQRLGIHYHFEVEIYHVPQGTRHDFISLN